MNGVCKIPLCRKIREKLKVQKAGRESRDLKEIWRMPKLWEAIRDYLGKVRFLVAPAAEQSDLSSLYGVWLVVCL